MAKTPSLIYQVKVALNSLICFGESKYDAKQKAISIAKASGLTGWNPAIVEGIYSISSMKSYRKESISFVKWAKDTHQVKWLHQAKEFVDEYLLMRMKRGDSAWSLKLVRSALRKLFQDPQLSSQIILPIREKKNIKRSRGSKPMDKNFSVERNLDLIDICRATGLRRHELKLLKVKNIYRTEDRLWVFVEQGKGGRPRTLPVLRSLESCVLEIIKDRNADELLFDRIPVRADVHGYRRDYANSLYQELAGKPFTLRDKEKDVMLLVSAALGHNRIDIVSRNYLDCTS
jgi:integrase